MSLNELCPSVKSALETLSTELTGAETARAALLSQVQRHVVEEFAKYPHKLRVQEVNIRARNKAFEKFVKKQKDFVSLKGNARPERQAHAKDVLDHERQRLQGAESTLNASLAAFEAARVHEMQTMLKKLISSQLHFFAKSMEGLSNAYARVCEIDGDREGERLVEEMRKLEALEQKDDHGSHDAAADPHAQAGQLSPSPVSPAPGLPSPTSPTDPAAGVGQAQPQVPAGGGYPQPVHAAPINTANAQVQGFVPGPNPAQGQGMPAAAPAGYPQQVGAFAQAPAVQGYQAAGQMGYGGQGQMQSGQYPAAGQASAQGAMGGVGMVQPQVQGAGYGYSGYGAAQRLGGQKVGGTMPGQGQVTGYVNNEAKI